MECACGVSPILSSTIPYVRVLLNGPVSWSGMRSGQLWDVKTGTRGERHGERDTRRWERCVPRSPFLEPLTKASPEPQRLSSVLVFLQSGGLDGIPGNLTHNWVLEPLCHSAILPFCHPPILPSSHPPILPSSHPPILPSCSLTVVCTTMALGDQCDQSDQL
jgi:hypothetical protein